MISYNSNKFINFITSTEVALRLTPNMVSNSNDETKFPNKLLLNDREVVRFHNAFVNNSPTNRRLSKMQISKIIQLCGFFCI